MRKYEMTLVLRADLSDSDLTIQLETIQGWIEANGGKIAHVDHWGLRRLAYPIAKQRDGYYVLFEVELPPNAPTGIEQDLRIAENVLRYLIIRKDS